MLLHTQTNSRSRLKHDVLGDNALKNLYEAFQTDPDDVFERKCIEIVQSGGGGQKKKDEIIAGIKAVKLKDKKLKKAQDFIFAGMGLGV